MKKQDLPALHEMSLIELREFLEKSQRELTIEKSKNQAGKSKGGSLARASDSLARILTIIREKELLV